MADSSTQPPGSERGGDRKLPPYPSTTRSPSLSPYCTYAPRGRRGGGVFGLGHFSAHSPIRRIRLFSPPRSMRISRSAYVGSSNSFHRHAQQMRKSQNGKLACKIPQRPPGSKGIQFGIFVVSGPDRAFFPASVVRGKKKNCLKTEP